MVVAVRATVCGCNQRGFIPDSCFISLRFFRFFLLAYNVNVVPVVSSTMTCHCVVYYAYRVTMYYLCGVYVYKERLTLRSIALQRLA